MISNMILDRKSELPIYRCATDTEIMAELNRISPRRAPKIGEIDFPRAEGRAIQDNSSQQRHSSKANSLARIRMESESLEGVNNKSHHNPSGGFTNPWPSFRNVGILNFMSYARKHWDREGSKVPPESELYVKVLEEKKMAWEKIRNPPKDRIQATWYRLDVCGFDDLGSAMRLFSSRWMASISSQIQYGLIGTP